MLSDVSNPRRKFCQASSWLPIKGLRSGNRKYAVVTTRKKMRNAAELKSIVDLLFARSDDNGLVPV
jgi:hypothetical protein